MTHELDLFDSESNKHMASFLNSQSEHLLFYDIYLNSNNVTIDLSTKAANGNKSHVSIRIAIARLVYLQCLRNNGSIQTEGCTKVEIQIKIIPLILLDINFKLYISGI